MRKVQLSTNQPIRHHATRGRQVPHGVERKMSGYPLRPRTPQPKTWINVAAAIQIIE